ncbi:MAG: hypothetical protein GF308_11640 [Candidatus Heimdallarchaeota archaeon]|nr:hypothetical protein [Candidatus Heimdallarchaeota archaeon]
MSAGTGITRIKDSTACSLSETSPKRRGAGRGSSSPPHLKFGKPPAAKYFFPKMVCPSCQLSGTFLRLYPVRVLDAGRFGYFSERNEEPFYCKKCDTRVLLETDYNRRCTMIWQVKLDFSLEE